MISNPPYGRKWEQDKEAVQKEAEKGFDGRFGAGLPELMTVNYYSWSTCFLR